jgi:sugar phosphate permease
MESPVTGLQKVQTLELSRKNVRWKSVPITLLIIWIVGMLDKIGVAVIATDQNFLTDMHLIGQNALIGSLVTALLFSYGIGYFFWGWLTDRFGPKRCGVVGLIFWGVSTALAAISPNFTMLFISRCLLGLSEAFLWPVSNSLTARWFPYSERGRAKSIWINGVSIGAGIAGFVILGLLQLTTWRGIFWILTGLSFIICLPMMLLLINDDPEKDKRVSEEELRHIKSVPNNTAKKENSNKPALLTNNYWLIVISFTATTLGVYGLGTWFPSYLKKVMHFNHTLTSIIMLCAWSTAMILTFWVGSRTDKTQKKAVWNIVGFLGAAIVLVLTLLGHSAIADALLVGAAVALIQGFTTPIGQGLIHSVSNTENIGMDTGILSGFSNVVAAFGPMIMGALITVGNGSYKYSFTFLIIVFLISAGCGVILKRRGY